MQARRNSGALGKSNARENLAKRARTLAQRNRRSVSENAPLQNRFRERTSKGWAGIKLEWRKLRFTGGN